MPSVYSVTLCVSVQNMDGAGFEIMCMQPIYHDIKWTRSIKIG